MSRILNKPILISKEINVEIKNQKIYIKGKKGILSHKINEAIKLKYKDNIIKMTLHKKNKKNLAIAGTTHALINNMILGVSQGFQKTLKLIGVGYKAVIENKTLILSLGFSHSIKYNIPDTVSIECPSNSEIIINGSNKQIVGQTAADLRSYKKPEPYKGKGIRYDNEIVYIKESKKK